MNAAPPPLIADIAGLRQSVTALRIDTTVDRAADVFLSPEYAGLLCLPVVQAGRVRGTVSRHALNKIFLQRFGRELLGGKPVSAIMNPQPLVVPIGTPLEAAVADVTARIGTPLTEDFVIIDAEGQYLGMGVVLDLLGALRLRVERDAAQLADAYRSLKSSQAALVQSEKMASLGQMVAGVAHEINTPLGYVRNNVELMRSLLDDLADKLGEHRRLVALLTAEVPDEAALGAQLAVVDHPLMDLDAESLEDNRALIEDTLFGVDQIRDLVLNLKNFSRLDQSRLAAVSLNDCLEQTLTIANNVIRNRVEVIKRLAELPAVTCSPSQINQVLLNLITNAVQAMPESGGKLLLKTEADEDWVRVSVQDNGKGIAPEHLPKIFDPFFTTKAVGEGTGLGLSISYQIVEAHHGRLEVASKLGVGTRFVLSLPRQAGATALGTPA